MDCATLFYCVVVTLALGRIETQLELLVNRTDILLLGKETISCNDTIKVIEV